MTDYMQTLPYHGYQDNEVVGWIVESIQETGINPLIEALNTFKEGVGGATMSDYVAIYLGLQSIGLWDKSWDETLKLDLLSKAPEILRGYGTMSAVITALGVLAPGFVSIWESGVAFLLDQSPLPASLSKQESYRFRILMSPSTTRDSTEWKTAELVADTLTPAFTDTLVSYDGFYLNLSKLGDSLFS